MSGAGAPEVRQQLLDYITGARWFGGKGRLAELAGLTALAWLTEPNSWPAVRVEIAEISYLTEDELDASEVAEPSELYQLLVSYRQAPQPDLHHAEIARLDDPELGPVIAYDAALDQEASGQLCTLLLQGARFISDESKVAFQLVNRGALTGREVPEVFTGQQSNTSIMYGDVGILKLFRRLELGRNLDIEVHETLSHSRVADVAQLFGWIEASWVHQGVSVTSDLAMMVERLAQAEDGWALALDSLKAHSSVAGPGEAESGFAAAAGDLGRALAEIHLALQQEFVTALISGADVASIMKARLANALAVAPALAPYQEGLSQCFDALSGYSLRTQRVHGDFHLGQTLRTPSGWKIIDFEGEPAKTLAERSEPDSVFRDIAGMLRSFDYAAASEPGAHSSGWRDASRKAFLDGYTAELSVEDAAVLRAYEADKAIYEVVYEVRNRPDWVNIPLAAIAALDNPRP